MRRYALLSLFIAGCGEDFFEVRTKGLEPAPQVSAFHQTLGDPALNVSFLDDVPTDSQGDFTLYFGDGSVWSGNIDEVTGAFDVLLELPPGYFLVSVHDVGTLTFDSNARVVAADWRQIRSNLDGSYQRYDMDFTIGGSRMLFNAVDVDAGTVIEGIIIESSSALVIDETWELENEYRDGVRTRYPFSGDLTIVQTWTRDEAGTAPAEDRTGNFIIRTDGSGDGVLRWNYDNGIYSTYVITLATNGSATYDLLFDDPATTFTDGQGQYQLDASYDGNGFYLESYEDGSELRNDYLFYFDGSTNALFRFEDPATAASPDVDGETTYEPDGSGTGSWNRYDATGAVIESCDYTFDSAGSITSLICG